MQFPPLRQDKNSDRDNKVLARNNDTLTVNTYFLCSICLKALREQAVCAKLRQLTVKVKAVLSKIIVKSKKGHQRGFVQ